ncbi:MAG: hypothetical protein E7266_00410 [Lachnospiraceae bacterium]|nr:hypothetical protein [Lachnospiraceae bacterium]
MSGQQFNNGILQVYVPSGWMLFYGIDSDGNASPQKIHIYKDAQTELDIFSKAGITIRFYGKDEIFFSVRALYDNVCDLKPFKCGKHLWNGYTCTSFGYPYTMLVAKAGKVTFQVMILTENGDHKISLDDEDVRAILASIEACT